MTALVLSEPQGRVNNLTLALAAHNIPTISRWPVLWHQIVTLLYANPGLWLVVHLWFSATATISNWFWSALDSDPDDEDASMLGLFEYSLSFIGSVILFIISVGVWVAYDWNWVLLLAVPAVVGVINIILTNMLSHRRLDLLLHSWQHLYAHYYFRHDGTAPAHILKRYEALKDNEDVDVFVLAFANDPFLVAVEKSARPWWLRRKAVIGAWNTNTPMDQI